MSKGLIRPEEAHMRASQMRNLANDMENLLVSLHGEMDKIGDVAEGINAGTRSATNTSAEFDELVTKFPEFHKQIEKFAENVDLIANTMVEE